jgi:aminoglycoside phosphotransferase (APT) family kinase protein
LSSWPAAGTTRSSGWARNCSPGCHAAHSDAPANPFRGIPFSQRGESFEANLALLSGQVDESRIRRAWSEALAAPAYDGPPLWLHGDLHPANILVSGRLVSGVIDFGDITAGDLASDLSVAWMLLPLEWHDAFRAAYGGIAGDLWLRARGWALALGVVFLARSADNPQLSDVGRHTVAAVLAGS